MEHESYLSIKSNIIILLKWIVWLKIISDWFNSWKSKSSTLSQFWDIKKPSLYHSNCCVNKHTIKISTPGCVKHMIQYVFIHDAVADSYKESIISDFELKLRWFILHDHVRLVSWRLFTLPFGSLLRATEAYVNNIRLSK